MCAILYHNYIHYQSHYFQIKPEAVLGTFFKVVSRLSSYFTLWAAVISCNMLITKCSTGGLELRVVKFNWQIFSVLELPTSIWHQQLIKTLVLLTILSVLPAPFVADKLELLPQKYFIKTSPKDKVF